MKIAALSLLFAILLIPAASATCLTPQQQAAWTQVASASNASVSDLTSIMESLCSNDSFQSIRISDTLTRAETGFLINASTSSLRDSIFSNVTTAYRSDWETFKANQSDFWNSRLDLLKVLQGIADVSNATQRMEAIRSELLGEQRTYQSTISERFNSYPSKYDFDSLVLNITGKVNEGISGATTLKAQTDATANGTYLFGAIIIIIFSAASWYQWRKYKSHLVKKQERDAEIDQQLKSGANIGHSRRPIANSPMQKKIPNRGAVRLASMRKEIQNYNDRAERSSR